MRDRQVRDRQVRDRHVRDRQVTDSLPHEVLQHGALPRALPPHHGDLRQVQAGVLPDGGEGVLQPVHQRDQVLHAPVPHGERTAHSQGETGGAAGRQGVRQEGGRDGRQVEMPQIDRLQ